MTRTIFDLAHRFRWAILILVSVILGGLLGHAQKTSRHGKRGTDSAAGGRAHHGERPDLAVINARSKQWNQWVKDSGMVFDGEQPPYSALGDDGSVDEASLKRIGIPEDQWDDVKKIVDQGREEMAGVIATNTRELKNKSDPEEGTRVYFVAADPEKGREVIERMAAGLEGVCGKDKSEGFLKAFPFVTQFGFYGRHDITAKWEKVSVNGSPRWQMGYQCVDPKTGMRVASGELRDAVSLRAAFGSAFEVDFEN
jgi:hypothetical protein